MERYRRWGGGPLVITGTGLVLALTALIHHGTEAITLGTTTVPLVALALDGAPAAALAYAGYRLRTTTLEPGHEWLVAAWCLGGFVVFTSAIGLTIVVRLLEDRLVSEPQFTLLVAASFGGLAGSLAGYYRARSLDDASRAKRASDTLAFVNSLIRHDLRNDMQVIRAYAGEIEEASATDGADDEVVDHAAVVCEKADEAFERIETTGSLAKTVAGEADYEPVDLVAVVADVAANAQNASGATVTTDLPERAPVVANAGLRSVIDNLVENAIEHNDDPDPRVSLRVEAGAETTRLTVSDNGPGVPAGERPSAFQAGDDTDGGGLRIAVTLVDRYGGDLWIEDGAEGATVVVELRSATGDRETARENARATPTE